MSGRSGRDSTGNVLVVRACVVLKLVGLRQKSSERTGRCACRSIVCSCLTRASLSAAAADEAEAEEEEADEKQTIDISRGKH